MSKNAYSVADGHVLRGAEKVAAYDSATGTLDFLPGKANYRAPVVRYLREQGLPAEVPPDRPPGELSEPRASRVGVNLDRPAEPEPAAEPAGEVMPENPGGVEPGAPELLPAEPAADPAPAPEPAAPAKATEPETGHVRLPGGGKAYRDRLTPEGWV